MQDLEILSQLETVVGNGAILTGDEVRSRAAAWDRQGGCNAFAIVRPSKGTDRPPCGQCVQAGPGRMGLVFE